ncbi:MAG: glycosyltransferase family 4 protein [Candidatus Omnitrophica bacterium]|nr:glycosyltransferase family 4 protein [Candidatus Omnitrophota bacterium]
MKVIFITREGYNLSGARVRCYNFARALRKYGIDTEVFSFADSLGAKYGEKESEMPFRDKVAYNIKALKILLKKEKGSVFFMQRLNYHTVAPFIASLVSRNKFVFDCDDWNIRENPEYRLGFYPSSKMEFLTRRMAACSNICIAASLFLKDYLSRFNSRVYYIPTGVDTESFKPNSSLSDETRIVFSWVGTVYHKEMSENIKFILDCFLMLADKYSNIYLDLAGEGKYFYETSVYLKDHRHKDRVIINDWILPDKIPDHLSRIDIGLLPLTQETRFNKAKSPTKLFEYMAMAKPTVSSNIGEASCIIKNGYNGFLAKTKERFMEDMERLIRDPDLRKDMACKARKTVEEKYSLDVLTKQLSEILKTV